MEELIKIKEWFQKYEDLFSIELNGFKNKPIISYISILPLIDRGGKLLDIGCGNGMFLKFICEFAGYKLQPNGIDCDRDAIENARTIVFPAFAKNFLLNNIDDCLPLKDKFDIIICNPFHSKKSIDQVIHSCINMLSPSGKLIIRIHNDNIDFSSINELKSKIKNSSLSINLSKCLDVYYGIIE